MSDKIKCNNCHNEEIVRVTSPKSNIRLQLSNQDKEYIGRVPINIGIGDNEVIDFSY